MDRHDVTAVILTYNEEIHIARCIGSIIDLVSDIVVVDSFSTDNTVSICEKLGARVFQNPWKNYATQFQWGLDETGIKTEWVMRIDADEYLEAGHQEFQHVMELQNKYTGVYIKRKYYFMDKWIRFGAMYPISHLRLWRNNAGRIENRWMDEHIVLNQGDTLEMDIIISDNNKNNLNWWVDKHNSYATREMIDSLNNEYCFLVQDDAISRSGGKQAIFKRWFKEKVYLKLPLFVRPVFYFIYRYFFRLGFLDGKRGFIFHFMQAFWYRMLVDFKTYEANRWLGKETNPKKIKEILKAKTNLDI